MVLHSKILTNDNRVRRGLTNDTSCAVCGHERETTDNLLRDFPHAKAVWSTFARRGLHCLYPGTSLREWIEANVTGNHSDMD